MARHSLFWSLIIWNFLFCCSIYAQTRVTKVPILKELPYMQHFTPVDYEGHRQNWSLVQDHRGVLYVGNSSGLLTYDGVSWRLQPATLGLVIRALTIDDEGRIWYGAKSDFGYLASDSLGQIEAISLRSWLSKEIDDIQDVWAVQYLNGKIYFQTYEYLFAIDLQAVFLDASQELQKGLHHWKAVKRFQGLSVVRDTLYIWEQLEGLKYVRGDSLELSPGGETFLRFCCNKSASTDWKGLWFVARYLIQGALCL